MEKRSFASSLPEERHEPNEGTMVRVSFEDMRSLREHSISHEETERLRALAERPDSEIDFSDIPELSSEEMERGVRGLRPGKKAQVTLWLDDEVLPWLLQQLEQAPRFINHTLRREMQYQQRKSKERAHPSNAASHTDFSAMKKAS